MSSLLAAARTRRESGFTLIELLTVIVIIGILAAIAIPVFTSQRGRAVDADAVSESRSVVTALESLAAATTAGTVTGDASTDAGRKALATSIMAEGAAVVLPKTTAGGTTNAYAGDTALAFGDNAKTQIIFSGTGYTVETVTTNGKVSKVANGEMPTANFSNVNSSVTTVTGNNSKFDRSTSGVSAVTAGTVVLGW